MSQSQPILGSWTRGSLSALLRVRSDAEFLEEVDARPRSLRPQQVACVCASSCESTHCSLANQRSAVLRIRVSLAPADRSLSILLIGAQRALHAHSYALARSVRASLRICAGGFAKSLEDLMPVVHCSARYGRRFHSVTLMPACLGLRASNDGGRS
jgi:hypothetical protein